MKVELDIHHDPELLSLLRSLDYRLGLIAERMKIMSLDLTKLQTAATAAEATITDLRTQLAAAKAAAENPADQTAINTVADQLTAAAAPPA